VLRHPLRQMSGGLGIGAHRVRRPVVQRPGSGITGDAAPSIPPLPISRLRASGHITPWPLGLLLRRTLRGARLRLRLRTGLRMRLGLCTGRRVRRGTAMLVGKREWRQGRKNPQTGSLCCPSSKTRSGLGLHCVLFFLVLYLCKGCAFCFGRAGLVIVLAGHRL
jgi:hypothetical protein